MDGFIVPAPVSGAVRLDRVQLDSATFLDAQGLRPIGTFSGNLGLRVLARRLNRNPSGQSSRDAPVPRTGFMRHPDPLGTRARLRLSAITTLQKCSGLNPFDIRAGFKREGSGVADHQPVLIPLKSGRGSNTDGLATQVSLSLNPFEIRAGFKHESRHRVRS